VGHIGSRKRDDFHLATWSKTMPDKRNSKIYLSFVQLQTKLGGRGRTSIYRDVSLGRLPEPVKLGSRLYWNDAEIDAALIKGAA
jgi:prophage regulatory protein